MTSAMDRAGRGVASRVRALYEWRCVQSILIVVVCGEAEQRQTRWGKATDRSWVAVSWLHRPTLSLPSNRRVAHTRERQLSDLGRGAALALAWAHSPDEAQ